MDIFNPSPIEPREAGLQNPLVLAFIGDGVFELFIRTLLMKNPKKVAKLHREAAKIVCAKGQSQLADQISYLFNDNEARIFRRGRNTNQKTMAKNAKVSDYRKATGLEALFGYLYLSGQEERMEMYFKEIERILSIES